jgi:Gluconate 2-dehydrogenase subunit 3
MVSQVDAHEQPPTSWYAEAEPQGAIMKRRELLRAGVLTGAAAALRPPLVMPQSAATPSSELTPAQRGADATNDLAAPGWKPLFLDEHQNETLIALSDLIIPATDTPGAKEALVNRYIDLVLAADTHENQRVFLNSLGYLDGESIRRYKAAFRYLSREDQDDLLHALAYPRGDSGWTGEAAAPDVGHAHFEQFKQRIGIAYYNSQTGARELGWDGAFAHGTYQGCEHPEGNHK